ARRRPRRASVVAVAEEKAAVVRADLARPDDVHASAVRAPRGEVDGECGLVVVLRDAGWRDGRSRPRPRSVRSRAGSDVDLAAAARRAPEGRGQERVVLAAGCVDAEARIAERAPCVREPEAGRERARPAYAAVGGLVDAHR